MHLAAGSNSCGGLGKAEAQQKHCKSSAQQKHINSPAQQKHAQQKHSTSTSSHFDNGTKCNDFVLRAYSTMHSGEAGKAMPFFHAWRGASDSTAEALQKISTAEAQRSTAKAQQSRSTAESQQKLSTAEAQQKLSTAKAQHNAI
jgi:hypothetical protein